MAARPEAGPPEQVAALNAAFAELSSRIDALEPDTVVLIAAEHWANFFLDNFPAFCVGTADHFEGPIEDWLRVPKVRLQGNPELARAIVENAMADGIEPATSQDLRLDHGSMVPLHFLTPRMSWPVVPIIQNCLQPPMPRPSRCYAFGESIGRTIASRPERVVIIASGGLSHWPGHRRHGEINTDWDDRVLDLLRQGKGDELSRYTDEMIGEAGTGAAEIRNWITLIGAAGTSPVEVLTYQPVTAFATGCAVTAIPV
jgi:2,3-dihydroxyphenylpropionate 1,2-dioxygenase